MAAHTLTADQLDYFASFGFLRINAALGTTEVGDITGEADRLWREDFGREPSPSEQIMQGGFVERSDRLFELVDHPAIHGALSAVLGEDMVFCGSEGNRGVAGLPTAHNWHADRRGAAELGLMRVKVMIYLSPMTESNGALRVIPGSHRAPLHVELLDFNNRQTEADPRYFGVGSREVPAHVIETTPGDVVMFNQSLCHAVYFTDEPVRRYIALKYAARPRNEEEWTLLGPADSEIFAPHARTRDSQRPRVRKMVDPLLKAVAAARPPNAARHHVD